MELVKDIAAVIGCLVSFITLVTLCSKGGRAFIRGIFQKNTKDLREQNEQQSEAIHEIQDTLHTVVDKLDAEEMILMQECRNTIKNIYYKYQKEKKIPLYERKTADKTFEIYTGKFNGNSYAQLLYNEICKWEIDTVSYDVLEEE